MTNYQGRRDPQDEIESQIVLLIIDESYWVAGDTDGSADYQKGLEKEFGTRFEEANIGPGFDIPAFFTNIATLDVPLWTVVFATFLLGKPVNENLDAWKTIGEKIRRFFSRPVMLSRNGASVLAVEAVFAEIGGMPKTIRLLSYRSHNYNIDDDIESYFSSMEIAPIPPTLNVGIMKHVFEIEADGTRYRVAVNGKETEIIKL